MKIRFSRNQYSALEVNNRRKTSSGFVYIALEWFVGCFAPKKPIKEFPEIRSPFLKMPATVLAQLIRRRQITSTEIVELYIDRIVDVSKIKYYPIAVLIYILYITKINV